MTIPGTEGAAWWCKWEEKSRVISDAGATGGEEGKGRVQDRVDLGWTLNSSRWGVRSRCCLDAPLQRRWSDEALELKLPQRFQRAPKAESNGSQTRPGAWLG